MPELRAVSPVAD